MTDAPTVGKPNGRFRIRVGLGVTIIGFIIYLLGAEPGLFFLDRSPILLPPNLNECEISRSSYEQVEHLS